MSKKIVGKKDVMEEYLSSLLTEDVAQKEPLEQVSRLLDSASVLLSDMPEANDITQEQTVSYNMRRERPQEQVGQADDDLSLPAEPELVPEAQASIDAAANLAAQDTGMYTQPFQALIFEVAGLSLALPLTELGGIHQLADVTPLIGKPKWFKGVMLHRDEKMNVVDTAMWVMPDKCNEQLADSATNKYLIMLDDSGWGLACERIIDTVTLQPDDVKWRKFDGKRTWLSGMVKKKMCALVNVKQLIRLLHQGMNSNDN
ncbi:chemotaxis protein CheW [Paraglaciecola polaris]|uniref:Purine-binding chemotaxis protein CheW n=1 Tax=Paraglaciecola polaris LMG 21857 TaxID=1129793 RepID=K7A064_9ALTE|nr:chemotaxis protein CheW [Paraglaciecola polaris]GAC34348.1 purine-binding chemotaxis protein CheW [Paraglaciecola polaris LMG 21857]|tara:strand:+ start:175 stop:948 length:774 start_codon:yes stop_codon:yes gene_type:complete